MDTYSFEPMLERSSKINGEMADGRRRRQVLFASSLEKQLTISLAVALVVIICLIAGLSILLLKPGFRSTSRMCLTSECIKSASNILESMDMSVNPCDNFYNFTCGHWSREHIIREEFSHNNWFSERSTLLTKATEEYLKLNDSEDEPKSVHSSRLAYRACLKYDENLESTKTLFKMLKKIGINIEALLKNEASQSPMKTLGRAKRFLGLDAFIGLEVVFDPLNTTILKVGVSTPEDLVFPGFWRKAENGETSKIDPLVDLVTKLFLYFLPEKEAFERQAEESAQRLVSLIDLFTEVEKSAEVLSGESIGEHMTILELQELVDSVTSSNHSKIRWKDYLNAAFEDFGYAKDLRNENHTVIVFNKRYYQLLSEKLEGISSTDLEIYVFWRIFYTLGYHINYQLTEFRSSLDFLGNIKAPKRSTVCAKTISSLMKIALSYRLTTTPKINKTRNKVKEMVHGIQDVFKDIVQRVTWMDEGTRRQTIEKVSAMNTEVSFFDEMMSKEWIDFFYRNVSFSQEVHLKNVLSLLEKQFEIRASALKKTDAQSTAAVKHLLFDYLDVNAFYSLNDNTIYVPNGILQFPFFGLGLEALNYGSIGVILGHELTHGFDDTGRMFDERGNRHDWWSEESSAEYMERINCYVEKYGSFHIPSIQKTINGNLTLAENIADNGGLIEALAAYRSYVKIHGPESSLPGLEEFSGDQLFFLSYTNTWCSVYTKESLLDAMEDEHSPSFVRPLVGLQNLPEFSEVWKCPPGSYMNPSHKCKLWAD